MVGLMRYMMVILFLVVMVLLWLGISWFWDAVKETRDLEDYTEDDHSWG